MATEDKPKVLRVKNVSQSIQHVVPGRLVPPDGVAELNESEQAVFNTGLDGNPARQRQFKATWQIVVAADDDPNVARRVVKRPPVEPSPEPVVEPQPGTPPPIVPAAPTGRTR